MIPKESSPLELIKYIISTVRGATG